MSVRRRLIAWAALVLGARRRNLALRERVADAAAPRIHPLDAPARTLAKRGRADAARPSQPRAHPRRSRRSSLPRANGPGRISTGSPSSPISVEKPSHEISADREATARAASASRSGGFRAGRSARRAKRRSARTRGVGPAAEIGRSAEAAADDAPESSSLPLAVSVSFEKPVEERSNGSPRFHEATKESGLGAPRQRSAFEADESPDRRHLAWLRRRRSRLQRRRIRGSVRRRRRALDPLRERRPRSFHRRHGREPVSPRRMERESPRPAWRPETSTATAGPISSSPTRSARRGSSATAATARSKRSRIARDYPSPATPAPRPSPTWTATGISTSSCASPGTTTTRCRIRRTTPTTGAQSSLHQRRARPLHRRHRRLGPRKGRRAGRSPRSSPTTTATGRPDLLVTNDFGLKNLYHNEGGRFVDVGKKTGTQARAYGMSAAWADFDGDGLLDLYTTGTDTQWYFLHEYPSLPIGFAGTHLSPDRNPVDGDDVHGQHAAAPEDLTTPSKTRRRARGRDRPAGTGAPSRQTSTTIPGPTSMPPTGCGETDETTTASSSSGGSHSPTGTITSPGRRRSTARAWASRASSAIGISEIAWATRRAKAA